MADARRRRFDCLLVWKYDRFARSLGTLIAALAEFNVLGIDFISHTQANDTRRPWAGCSSTSSAPFLSSNAT